MYYLDAALYDFEIIFATFKCNEDIFNAFSPKIKNHE